MQKQPIVEVRDLVKLFGEHAAVDHVSFAVEPAGRADRGTRPRGA